MSKKSLFLLGCATFLWACSSDNPTTKDGAPADTLQVDADLLVKDDAIPKEDMAPKEDVAADLAPLPDGILSDADRYATCINLQKEYDDTVPKAKACDPLIFKIQCTVKALLSIDCPCETYFGLDNKADIQKLEDLSIQWGKLDCETVIGPCPPIECKFPTGAECSNIGGGIGICEDKY
ncbi:MAG: hypothetical protein V1754_12620 [Pseudomonadota bacterium]